MKKILLLIAVLLALTSCGSTSSVTSPVVKTLGKRISLVATTPGGLAKRDALPKVSDAVTPGVLPLDTVYKPTPNYFELRDDGDSSIVNLMIKSSRGIVVPQRMEFGALELPNKQSVVPILGLAVLTYGENPWSAATIATADTGAGTDTLTFYDVGTAGVITDSSEVVGRYVVTYTVMLAIPAAIITIRDTVSRKFSTVISNAGNCPFTVYTGSSVMDTVTAHVVLGGATDTLQGSLGSSLPFGPQAAGQGYVLPTSTCVFAEDLSKLEATLVYY